MTIQTFLDPTLLPNRTQDQTTFDNAMAYVMQNLSTWGNEVNGTLGGLNALLAGGAYALPYVFDTSTVDADPGVGKLRLSSTTQNAATVLRLDTTAGGADISSMLDTFDASTSPVKGSFKIVKVSDLSKFLTFDIMARTAPSGYRNFAITNTGGSSANPFANGDAVLVFFQRNGDQGAAAVSALQYVGGATINSAVSVIDFATLFTSAFDKYQIEVSNITVSASSALLLSYANAGVYTASGYTPSFAASGGTSAGLSSAYSSSSFGISMTMSPNLISGPVYTDVSNTNDTRAKSLYARGICQDAGNNYLNLFEYYGACNPGKTISGFRLSLVSGASFLTAKVAVYGLKNSA
jgi:hypothetical protein